MNAQVVLYNNDEQSDPQAVDMSVVVAMGGLRIVFLNWFISNVLVPTCIYNFKFVFLHHRLVGISE